MGGQATPPLPWGGALGHSDARASGAHEWEFEARFRYGITGADVWAADASTLKAFAAAGSR